jgi:cell division septation protein DedD
MPSAPASASGKSNAVKSDALARAMTEEASTAVAAKTPAAASDRFAASQPKKTDKAAAPSSEKKKEPSAAGKTPQKEEANDADRVPKGSAPFAVQIGIFAQEGNASKALAAARSAGFPAFADTVNGDQQRVRAGPFASQAEAERAARKIKALDLPAVVVRIRKAGDAAASPAP